MKIKNIYTPCSENCGNMVKNNEENTIPICSPCEEEMIYKLYETNY